MQRLDPIDAPRLTAEELEEKLRIAERKRNNVSKAKTRTGNIYHYRYMQTYRHRQPDCKIFVFAIYHTKRKESFLDNDR